MSAKTTVRSLGSVMAAALAASALLGGSPTADAAPTSAAPSEAQPTQQATPARPDFNGDGNSDLAIVSLSPADKGAVHVMYGSESGLRAPGAQRFTRSNVPTLAGVNVYTFGKSLAPGDFNGDGYGDLAVGVEKLEVFDDEVTGAFVVLYGSAQGLKATGSQYVTRQSLQESKVEFDGRFAYVTAAADFGRGSATDLAVSSTAEGSGAVRVLYGSANGLSLTDGQVWSPATAGVKGTPDNIAHFGDSMVADNFDGSGPAELAIGAPGTKVGKVFSAGAVHVLKGSANGLTAAGDQLWYRDKAGIKGKAKDATGFGFHLASGHFAGRQAADLVVTTTFGGSVAVIYGSSKGLTASGDQVWTKKSKGLPAGSLAADITPTPTAGNFGHDPAGKVRDDLAICGPGKTKTGAALILYGASKGLSASGSKQFGQAGLPDVPGDGVGFCGTLATGAFDGGPYAALAIGSQKGFDEDDGQQHVYAPGTVHILAGSKGGLTTDGVQLWTAATLSAPAGDSYLFGLDLATSGR